MGSMIPEHLQPFGLQNVCFFFPVSIFQILSGVFLNSLCQIPSWHGRFLHLFFFIVDRLAPRPTAGQHDSNPTSRRRGSRCRAPRKSPSSGGVSCRKQPQRPHLRRSLVARTPRKMNGWNLRIHPWKRKIIFQTIIFRFYVNLPGCSFFLSRWTPTMWSLMGW